MTKPEDEQECLEDEHEEETTATTATTPPADVKNDKNGHAKPPPKIKVQVEGESGNMYKSLPDEDF